MVFYVFFYLLFRTRKSLNTKKNLEIASKKYINSDEAKSPRKVFNCTYDKQVLFEINSDNFRLYCDLKIEEIYPYDQISNVSIYLTTGKLLFRIDETPELPIDTIVTQLISNIQYTGPFNVYFRKFKNYTSIFSYAKYFPSDYMQLWFEIETYPKNCIWEYPSDIPDDLVAEGDKINWFKTCMSNTAYLFYNTFNEPVNRKVIFLSLGATIALIVLGTLIVVGIFISLCFVAKLRYDRIVKISSLTSE